MCLKRKLHRNNTVDVLEKWNLKKSIYICRYILVCKLVCKNVQRRKGVYVRTRCERSTENRIPSSKVYEKRRHRKEEFLDIDYNKREIPTNVFPKARYVKTSITRILHKFKVYFKSCCNLQISEFCRNLYTFLVISFIVFKSVYSNV